MGVLNNSSSPLLILQEKIKSLWETSAHKDQATGMTTMTTPFIRFSKGIRLHEAGSHTERQITFGHIWVGMELVAPALEPTWFCEISFSGSVRATPDSDSIS